MPSADEKCPAGRRAAVTGRWFRGCAGSEVCCAPNDEPATVLYAPRAAWFVNRTIRAFAVTHACPDPQPAVRCSARARRRREPRKPGRIPSSPPDNFRSCGSIASPGILLPGHERSAGVISLLGLSTRQPHVGEVAVVMWGRVPPQPFTWYNHPSSAEAPLFSFVRCLRPTRATYTPCAMAVLPSSTNPVHLATSMWRHTVSDAGSARVFVIGSARARARTRRRMYGQRSLLPQSPHPDERGIGASSAAYERLRVLLPAPGPPIGVPGSGSWPTLPLQSNPGAGAESPRSPLRARH